MAEASITIKGVQEVKSSLDKLEKDIESSSDTLKELGSVLASKASAMAPQKSGRLAASVGSVFNNGSLQIYAGNETIPYAGVIEYGYPLRNIKEQPYLRPAVNSNMGMIEQKYNEQIEKSIKKYNLD
jgi:HK97 gp10 family phage protein